MSLSLSVSFLLSFFFFFNDTATTEIYTLSLHDALPISRVRTLGLGHRLRRVTAGEDVLGQVQLERRREDRDRKSTRLNSSHVSISYAVFCLKKKKKKKKTTNCNNNTYNTTT